MSHKTHKTGSLSGVYYNDQSYCWPTRLLQNFTMIDMSDRNTTNQNLALLPQSEKAGCCNILLLPRWPYQKIATKQPKTPSITIARGWITKLMTSAYKIRYRGHFEFFFSTSNFISTHCPSIYKLSMIRFVHKVHLNVDFLDNTYTLRSFPVIIF